MAKPVRTWQAPAAGSTSLDGGQATDHGPIVRLHRVQRHAVNGLLAASFAAVNDLPSLPPVPSQGDWAHRPSAGIPPIAWRFVEMLRPQAVRAMVAVTAVGDRLDA